MTDQISFIHTADLHLDSPFHGLSQAPEQIFSDIKQSTFSALDHLVEQAILLKVDFILIVGDLFDQDVQSLKAQIYLRTAFEKLQTHNIHVYLSYGNHDFLNGHIHHVEYPDNVHIFKDEIVSYFTFWKDEKPLARIYGFSYENRAVDDNKAEEFEKKDPKIPYHIAMLHGSIQGDKEHATYAPFSLNELVDRDMDYWALGHIHKRQILREQPPIIYPGNIQGRHRNEDGEKGCYHLILNEHDLTYDFLPLHKIEFLNIPVDLSACNDIFTLETMIKEEMSHLKQNTSSLIVLQLEKAPHHFKEWELNGDIGELLDVLNSLFTNQTPWLYIYDYKMSYQNTYMKDILENEGHFLHTILNEDDSGDIGPYLRELYQHKDAGMYLEHPHEDDIEDISQKARELLIHELLKGD